MKVEELMIGDWVTITEPDDFHGYIGKVVITNAETNYIMVHIPNMHLHDVFVEDLQPIQLTQKILEQNGFLEVDKDKVKETATHVYLYMEDGEPEDGFAICGNDEYGYYLGVKLYKEPYHIFVGKYRASKDPNLMSYVYPTYNIKYVHKLQHILKDFEIEKEIIL